jgi:hypothetical protein
MQHTPLTASSLQLHRDDHGRLVLRLPDGTAHAGVLPVRAFPLAAPDDGLSLVGSDGHELFWLDRLDDLSTVARSLVQEELAAREFVPTIKKIVRVSSFSTPSTWHVETDRGGTQFTLKAEEDIRRLRGRTALLIASGEGVQYAIADSSALDKASRRLLERFL